MRVLVCGGREFDNFGLLHYTLEYELDKHETHTIIHGDAKGADFLARAWAKWVGHAEKRYPANWKTHGRKAGAIRNQQMLDEGKPDLVIAFPGGVGTADMVRRAKASGIEVREIKE